jgi:kynurenine formamidase
MSIIDLSVTINEQTPVYPGDPTPQIKPAGILANDGYNDHTITVGTHLGTHIDAPFHMLADGKTLDTFPLERFVGKGTYINVNGTYDLEEIKKISIVPNDIVIFDTGLGAKYFEPSYFEDYPAIPEDVATYLVEKKISMVGMDTCSPDHDEFIAHKILLAGNVLIVENLTNTHLLAGKQFTVYALPIKLEIDGAPARVIAEVQD